MTDTRLSSIENELTEAESQLTEALDALRQQVAQTEAKLKRVRKAVRALSAESATKGRAKRPAANRSDVRTAIASVLKQQGMATEADLKATVAQRISETGKSLQGFALRFREAIADSELVANTLAGYRLAGKQEASQNEVAADSVPADIGGSAP